MTGTKLGRLTHEGDPVKGQITQSKIFDQCDSASSFKANIQFSDSSSQANQKELVLSGSVGGEIAVSQLAKVQLQGAVEHRFSSIFSSGAGHQEGVDIEVPAHTKQEYTIIWREVRREGSIEYKENGEAKSVAYSYRVGLELISTSGKDLDCPNPVPAVGEPASPSEPAVVPTDVPLLPAPEVSLDTPTGTELREGEFWRTSGVGLQLTGHHYDVNNQCAAFSFDMTNASNQDLIVTILPEQFTATDNTGYKWTTYALSDTNYCYLDSGLPNVGQLTIEVPSGKDYTGGNNQWILSFVGPIADPQVTSLKIVVKGLSRFDDATWVIDFGR